MTIAQHAERFAGKPVRDYSPSRGIDNPTGVAYRFRQEYDADDEATVEKLLEAFLADPRAEQAQAIVIGPWSEEPESSKDVVEQLANAAGKLPNLRGLFLGDITYEELEISWIEQCDVSPLLKAFPRLEYFRVRGGQDLSLGEPKHDHLRSLIVEAGGLPKTVVQQVAAARLPELEHLELWLGTEEYGGDATVEDLRPILDGGLFPKLRYLGLRDSAIADAIAQAVALAPVLRQVRVLDLSLGTLGDVGAQALLASPAIARLEKLDLHHHFISKELMKRLSDLGIDIDLSDKQSDEDDYRFVAVSE